MLEEEQGDAGISGHVRAVWDRLSGLHPARLRPRRILSTTTMLFQRMSLRGPIWKTHDDDTWGTIGDVRGF
jgi:hypothetical protein